MTVPEALAESVKDLQWAHQHLDQIKIPKLPTEKRVQLAAACFHAAVRHQQAIVLLIEEDLPGSALALVRVVVEAFARGAWLAFVASDEAVDAAGRDKFPGFSKVVKAIEKGKPGLLTQLESNNWSRYCSYTHTGYRQIGARLCETGINEQFDPIEIVEALVVANFCVLASVLAVGDLAGDEKLIHEAHSRLGMLATGPSPYANKP